MDQTIVSEMILSNGRKFDVQTSTRQESEGEKSTFVSINTGHFRIRIVQRISLEDLLPGNAKIAFTRTSETDNLDVIKDLTLALEEAVEIADRLNKKVMP